MSLRVVRILVGGYFRFLDCVGELLDAFVDKRQLQVVRRLVGFELYGFLRQLECTYGELAWSSNAMDFS